MNKNKKQTVKNHKKNPKISTQRYLQFSSVHDDTLVLKNGGIRAVLECSSLNFSLKSEAEQQSIIVGYQRFLNALNFPVQIVVKSRKLDIDHYIDHLESKKKLLKNKLLLNQMEDYMEYIKRLVEYADIMEKRFYIVVPVNPPRAEKKGTWTDFLDFSKPDDSVLNILQRRKEFRDLKKELDSRLNVVKTSIEACNVNITQLKTADIIELFYQQYNPERARTQKFNEGNFASAISEEVLYE